jgi:hypothetical protein
VLLGQTQVCVQLDLSAPTRERLGARVLEVVTQRLTEEGFEVQPQAPLKLLVEELHGRLELTATLGPQRKARSFAPNAEVWRGELALELAQRLSVLAHEVEAAATPVTPPEVTSSPGEEQPPAEPEPLAARQPPAEPTSPPLHAWAGVRLGVRMRSSVDYDPALTLTGGFEPWYLAVAVGLTWAPGPGLSVFEVPLAVGARLPVKLGAWRVVPEVMVGARLQVIAGTLLDDAGVRVDPLATVGVSVLLTVGQVRLGLRLGLDVSTAREHVLGTQVLWSSGLVGGALQALVER